MPPEANRPIKALLTMDQIIEALDSMERAGVTDIAERINRPQSVVHDYLNTLAQLGYVVKTESTYELSLQFLELGGRIRDRLPLYDIAKPEIQRLADQSSSELVTLSVEQEGLCVALDVVQSSESIKYETIPGEHFHMHSSGVGKALLAHYSENRVEAILDEHGLPKRTENTITDREKLYEELEEIRERGISFEREEYKQGMMTIAAPIFGSENNVLGGISVSGPAHHLREPEVSEELQNKLFSAINIVELNIRSR